jgi:hypothetical protein
MLYHLSYRLAEKERNICKQFSDVATVQQWEILATLYVLCMNQRDVQNHRWLRNPLLDETLHGTRRAYDDPKTRVVSQTKRQRIMKVNHAVGLALVIWCLGGRGGIAVPKKDCPNGNCVFLYGGYGWGQCGFKTKAECEAARDKWIPNFYANAKKKGQVVVYPPSTPVCAQQDTAPK